MTRTARKIVIACELFYPDIMTTGYYVTALAERLAGARPVTVVTSRRNAYQRRDTPLAASESRNGVRILRCRATSFERHRLILRVVNVVSFSLSSWVTMFRETKRGDVLVVFTNPPLLSPAAVLIGRIRRARTVLIVHDLHPQAAVAAGLVPEGSVAHRVWGFISRYTLRAFDGVVTIGRGQREIILAERGHPKGVALIPNWAELDEVWPDAEAKKTFRQRHGIADHELVALFAGNHGRLQDLDTLLEAAELLRDEPVRFVFVGDGARKPWLKREVATRCLPNVLLLPAEPRGDQNGFLNGGDVSFVSLIPSAFGVGVPSRAYNSLAAGLPLVAVVAERSEVGLLVAEHDVGWVCESGEPDTVVAALSKALGDRVALASMAERCAEVARTHCTLDLAAARFEALLVELDR